MACIQKFGGKTSWDRLLGRLRRWEDNMKKDLKKVKWQEHGVDGSGAVTPNARLQF